jgi:hypothetical protein
MTPANTGKALAAYAVRSAVDAAVAYCEQWNLEPDADALATELRRLLLQSLPGALARAKEALACGMDRIAAESFCASMALCGIGAAKAVTGTD